MSHFSVLVITDREPTEDALGAVLQPWHEFECTGIADQYVQDVDRTEEARQYCEQREDKSESTADAVEGWFGWKAIGPDEQPDMADKHKYGYVRIDADGNIIQAIDRTNPNKKWDWWVVGGRWQGMLKLSPVAEVRHVERAGEPFPFQKYQGRPGLMGSRYSDSSTALDVCRRADLNIEGMKAEAVARRREAWNQTIAEAKKAGHDMAPEQLDALRRRYYLARKEEVEHFRQNPTPPADALCLTSSWRRQHYLTHMPADLLALDDVFTDFLSPRTTEADIPIEEWIAAAPALSTFAVVKDGQWYERGGMGWFGFVADEKDEHVWSSEFGKLLEGVPGDHWLTIVDCHI